MPHPPATQLQAAPVLRDHALDTARGLGIVLVVFGHLQRGFLDLGMTAHPGLLQASDFILYTTHMPLFFMLAGRNASASLRNYGRSGYLVTRPRAILWPYAAWSTLFVCAQQFASTGLAVHHPVPFRALLFAPVVPVGIFWFLQSLFCAQCLAASFTGRAGRLLILALAADLAVTLAVQPNAAAGLPSFALHLPFFAFGFLCAEHGVVAPDWLRDRLAVAPLLCGTIGLGLIAFACGSERPVDAVTLPISSLGIVAVLNLSRTLAPWRAGDLLASVGRASMPIYVLHIFTLPVFMRLAHAVAPRFDVVALAAGTVFGVAASLALFRVLALARLDTALGLSASPRTIGPASPPSPDQAGIEPACRLERDALLLPAGTRP